MKQSSLYTVPTMLTLFRLIFSPFLLPILLVTFIPYNNFIINCFLALVFALLSLTDFLDGFLARKWDQVSELGKLLDPLADKFLLYSSLIALLTVDRIYYYWVIVLIGRELFIMGLRLVALENGFEIQVSRFGKAKTVIQFFYLTLLIMQPTLISGEYTPMIIFTENLILFLTLFLSIGSAFHYYWYFMKSVGIRTYEGDFKL